MELTIFVGGDTMTGRGIDQILPAPSGPLLREPWIRDARDYVALAEEASGPIARPVSPAAVWGDALDVLARERPAARVVNLETSVTRSDGYWPAKEIHYRMHPGNVGCLTAAGIDVCVLANNHVLDFGRRGLVETLATLEAAGVAIAGAGRDPRDAWRPAAVELAGGGRLLVVAACTESSGVPPEWAAGPGQPGVAFLDDLSERAAAALARRLGDARRPGDRGMVSLHWGGNWGDDVPPDHVRFAHRLIDEGVDVVHGHSSHHPRPIEVYHGRLILYGCGELIDDYEGIAGHERYRGDLVLLYLPGLDAATGALVRLRMAPLRIRRMRLERASIAEARWLAARLSRTSARLGSAVEVEVDGTLVLRA